MRFSSALTTAPSFPTRVRANGSKRPVSKRNGEEGSGALELCLALPFFVLILAAATDFSLMCQSYMVVVDAAAAGARYGSSGGNSNDLTGMQNAAQSAAGGISGFSATAVNFCTCSPGGSKVSCSSSCPSQTQVLQYVRVTTKVPVALPFKALGLAASMQLAGGSTMRVSGATQ